MKNGVFLYQEFFTVYNAAMIISPQNPKVKLARSLMKDARDRRIEGAFIVEGVRLVEEAAASGWPFRFVLFSEALGERGKKLIDVLRARNITVESVADSILASVSATETTQGVLAVMNHHTPPLPASLNFVLILDSIRDPGNLGSLLRSAAAAGVQAVFVAPETTDAFSPKVVRAGMGAHFRLPILSLSWGEINTRTNGLQVFLAEMEGNLTLWQVDFRQPLALIIGGEAEGATSPARELASEQVHIPMPGRSESLNAAAAGSILLFEVVRQRMT
jgi:RNA methyltransferase, TrmH family